MEVPFEKLDDDISIQIFDSLSGIDEKMWNSINASLPFYQTHQFLSIVENIQKDICFRYVLIYNNNAIIAAIYVQLLDFSMRNLVNYSGDGSRGLKSTVKKYIAQKNTKVLNLGDIFFTGDKGIISENDEEIVSLIPEIFKRIHKTFSGKKPSASLVANIYLQDEEKCVNFCNHAYHPFNTEPDMYMHVDQQWACFEDFMDAFSSKYRVRAKKVLTISKEICRKEFSVDDIVQHKEELENLYNNVVNHVTFNMGILNIDFFERVKSLYGDKCSFFAYYLEGKMVSFACLFHVDPFILHVHYIGLNYEVNKEYKLYNRMLLDFVKFAIEHNIKTIHFGRTATEIKTTIGAEPKPLHAYLKLNNRLFNTSLPYFLNRIKPAEYIARNPFK
ncbi:MAG: hypothetical protein JWN78_2338 [Bacteroidota bacterium]|nr:hypothetical protein [Bacteroidota bacterium]